MSLWTAKEAAAHLAISRKTLYRLPLPCVRLGKSLRRYRPEDIAKFLKERTARVA